VKIIQRNQPKKRIGENRKSKKILVVIVLVIETNISYAPTINGKYGSAISRLWAPLQIPLDNGRN